MKKSITFLFFLCFILRCAFGQAVLTHLNPNKKASDAIDRFYIDASAGYYPKSENASWAAQIGSGYRLNEQSAFGIGLGTWGRIQNYERSAAGIGLQYRHNYPQRLITKFEVGYLFVRTMHDNVLNRKMVYFPEKSKPYYATISAHWRVWRAVTLGVSASQTTEMFFNHYITETTVFESKWRINAFTIQLGVAFDGGKVKSEK